MTLINFNSRIHFADGVLEEALVSELERNEYCKPLLVYRNEHDDGEIAERVQGGLTYQCSPRKYSINPRNPVVRSIADIIQIVEREDVDVVVAFGSSSAISLAGEGCQSVQQSGKGVLANYMRGAKRRKGAVDFFAVPGVDGVPDLSKPGPRRKTGYSTGVLYSGTGAQPSVVIYDPTLTLGESISSTASAAVNTLARCAEAYLSDNYNPPAEGIAYDGLMRIAKCLPDDSFEDNIETRREQMAASLQGTLAMQKGGGIAQELADALIVVSGLCLDEGALKRLLLPACLDMAETISSNRERTQLLRSALGISSKNSFVVGLTQRLDKLPLAPSFSALGITGEHIKAAVLMIMQTGRHSIVDADSLQSMMWTLHKSDAGMSA